MVLLFFKHLFDFQQFLMQLLIFGVQLGDFFFGDLMRIGWFKLSRDRTGQKSNDADAYDHQQNCGNSSPERSRRDITIAHG
mgnify:CR=1 FL=1